MPSGKTLLAGVLALAIAGSGAAVVGAQSPPATLNFDVTAKAATLTGQPAVKTGWNKLVFNWKGKGQGGLALVQLNDGVTQEQFGPAVAKIKDPMQIGEYGKIVASTFWVAGPAKYTTSIKLEDADYALVDLAKKPVARLGFHAGPEADPAMEPAVDVDVKLGDYAFSMPRTLKSGKQTFRTTNVGDQLHHALVMPLKPGVKDARILADLKKGKEPNYAIGGPPSALVEVVSPDTKNDVEMNLRKGKYLFVCFLQDSPKDKPHAMLGMRKIVTVK